MYMYGTNIYTIFHRDTHTHIGCLKNSTQILMSSNPYIQNFFVENLPHNEVWTSSNSIETLARERGMELLIPNLSKNRMAIQLQWEPELLLVMLPCTSLSYQSFQEALY